MTVLYEVHDENVSSGVIFCHELVNGFKLIFITTAREESPSSGSNQLFGSVRGFWGELWSQSDSDENKIAFRKTTHTKRSIQCKQ